MPETITLTHSICMLQSKALCAPPAPPLSLTFSNWAGFFGLTFLGVLAKMRVVIESWGAWHIVISQPTGVELITVIISHSISGQKPSRAVRLGQIFWQWEAGGEL